MTVEEIWRQVRIGRLALRHRGESVCVIEMGHAEVEIHPEVWTAPARSGATHASETGWSDSFGSLLIDHLSLAKEEHQSLIRFSETSLERMNVLHSEVTAMKDVLIEAKDKEIALLRAQIAETERQLQTERMRNDDLTMLNRSLAPDI